MRRDGLIRKIDCLQVPVAELDEALAFYGDGLGLQVAWRSDVAVGLRLPDDDAELVLQVERPDPETDLLVDDVDEAVAEWIAAGGDVEVEPFDIRIGRCAVVRDPFGNRLVILDMTLGPIIDAPTPAPA